MLAVLMVGAAVVAQPPKELPSVELVREALKENEERLKNRRVKYVMVSLLPGEPRKEFPPVDADRGEAERTIAADGRWREVMTVYRGGVVTSHSESANDGKRTTRVEGTLQPSQKLEHKATLEYPHRRLVLGNIDNSWEKLSALVGGRSRLAWADEKGLLLLDPRVDDRATYRTRYLLDPVKNYWPVELRSEVKNDKGEWAERGRERVVEFIDDATRVYPKRMTYWGLNGGKGEQGSTTSYYTVTSAEFPETFEDAEFRVAIPDGAAVHDTITAAKYVQGRETPKAKPPSTMTKVAAKADYVVKQTTLEDVLVYGGMFVGATAVALVGMYGFLRGKGKEEGGG